ncbi:alpha-methylacyl-CoA racemase-like [Drosophila miranda]|uniref:alpha-methylacyl-CoA racemase n=1 Tax=Drosophila miranda TaxID=7229 RepID=UPI0007E700C4|nr:alpha-methylacyl-CoA racemase [Drosophila miranda]XP_033249939.1 alpha-methylacyl-CoA racemase-like [Drosophila miranda]XP_033249940.1 alpha-methylacyl-CoA racemase-like [Drosophila miranda]
MPLKGIKVLEFVGLAPGPLCGKILTDFGATVTRIDKILDNQLDVLQHGKRTMCVNMKDPEGQQLVRRLAKKSDVLIEPFRPGVMEKLHLAPAELCGENPRLIYARLTGFGQQGRLAARAGHDLNYAAISGVLSMLGRRHEKPTAPINLLADFAGGSVMCALGICLALLERHNSGRGQVVDAAMVEGAAYVASWLFLSRDLHIWGKQRGDNILDGGAYFYDNYETKDGLYMSVGALEPQFFELLRQRLELPEDLPQFGDEHQERGRRLLTEAFLTKTQAQWSKIFEDIDACVYPVLDYTKVHQHAHNKERQSFGLLGDAVAPRPAPRLSRTPGKLPKAESTKQEELIGDLELKPEELKRLLESGVLTLPDRAKL